MTISATTRYQLWGRAAGHCEICHRSLEEDGAFKMSGNFSNIAHIRAQSADGPRYDENQTAGERDGIDNLLLLCPICHKNIDVDSRDDFPVERLLSIKAEREKAIRDYASLASIPKLNIITCAYPIRGEAVSIKDSEWKAAVYDLGMTHASSRAFDVSAPYTEGKHAADGLQQAAADMEARVERFKEIIEEPDCLIGIFALAPQPLLIKLGTLLSDKQAAIPFQWHRNGPDWSFRNESSGVDYSFRIVREGDSNATDVALTLSLSASVNVASLPEGTALFPLVELAADKPGIEIVSSIEDVARFGDEVASVVSNIHERYPRIERLHVFPAAPAPLASKFGMAVNRNLFEEMVIYDKQDGKFSEALRLR